MFVGHAALAFALAAWGTVRAGRDRQRALALAAVAAAFAAAPDVDMAYALVGVWRAVVAAVGPPGSAALVDSFWGTGNVVHRAVTHSLLVAPAAALAGALWSHGRRAVRGGVGVAGAIAVVVVAALVAGATAVSGPLGGVVMLLFGLAVLAVGEAAARRTDLGPRAVFAAGLVGTVTHPFGDLLTGQPPAMLYPLDATLFPARLAPFADPTLNLLTAFGAELAAIWLGVIAALWLSGVSPRVALDRRATLGAGYAAGALLLPAPTLDVAYKFVFSVLAVGLVGLAPRVELVRSGNPRIALPDGASAAVTGLAAVTLAGVAYALVYLLV